MAKRGAARLPVLRFRIGFRINAWKQCDGGDGACRGHSCDCAGHAKTPDCWIAAGLHRCCFSARPVRRTPAERKRIARVLLLAKGILKFASRPSPEEMKSPVATLNHRLWRKSGGNVFFCIRNFTGSAHGNSRAQGNGYAAARAKVGQSPNFAQLPAELQSFQPLNRLALVGDDLRLPD